MQETQETRVPSLCLEDLLEGEMATYSCFLAWEIPWTEEPGRIHGVTKSQTQLSTHTRTMVFGYLHLFFRFLFCLFLINFKSATPGQFALAKVKFQQVRR